jgi:hypothetical protein
MTARQVLARAMTEDELLGAVLELAALTGWRRFHIRPGMDRRGRWSTPLQGDPGWPDVVLVRDGRLLALELKSERGRPTSDQRAWLTALSTVPGVTALLVRPSDWPRVQALLCEPRPTLAPSASVQVRTKTATVHPLQTTAPRKGAAHADQRYR